MVKPKLSWNEDMTLLNFTGLAQDAWTLRDAYEGVLVFGGTGSGKTSGSGKALAHAFLKAGMGGIVLCAKPDEADNWIQYAKETGRSKSIIRFDGSGRYRFNFLEYEMRRNPAAADVMVSNVVNALMNIIEVASRGTGMSASSGGDDFWLRAGKTMIGYALDVLYATYGRVRLAELMELIESAPQSLDQLKDEHWQNASFFYQVFREFYATGGGRYPPNIEDMKRLKNYWFKNFPTMSDRTRSSIVTTLTTELDPLLRGRMRTIFSTETNIVPEMTHEGTIILLDFPVKEWYEAGILAQQTFKFMWQRATEQRKIDKHTRPSFLFSDECQFFLSGYDLEYQSTARGARACTVLMTQNLPTFFSRIGGSNPEHTVNAMIGNLRTKIFHANSDNVTNEWASKMIGRETVWRGSYSENEGWSKGSSKGINDGQNWGSSRSSSVDGEGNVSFSYGTNVGASESDSIGHNVGASGGTSFSYSEQRDNAVDPEDFGRDLLTGGKRNHYNVSGIVLQSGRVFARNQKNWVHVYFDQRT